MKKCVVISDSFKGSLSSEEICEIAKQSFGKIFPACQLTAIPVADGGEGTVACFHEVCGGREVRVTVQGPYGQDMETAYLQLDGGRAVIEMASCAGLPLVSGCKDPCAASTYGVGQQIRHAVQQGNRQILLGLGGSCTNDGGCGCGAALGVRFLDGEGRSFIPVGGTLERIEHIDVSGAEELLRGVHITAMCDIDNPMHGSAGAACIFGPQKGADPAMVEFLDHQLKALDETIRRELHQSVADVPGSGAAGAFGAGILAFLGGTLCPGIEAVLDLVDCDARLKAKAQNVPVMVVAGSVLEEMESVSSDPDSGITAVFSINRQAMDYSESKKFSRQNYQYTLENILRLLQCTERKNAAACPDRGRAV